MGDGDGPELGVRTWRRRWVRRGPLIGLGLVLVVVVGGMALASASNPGKPTEHMTAGGAHRGGGRFVELAAQHSNYCLLDPDTVKGYPDDQRMQGACCNPMGPEKYRQQVDGLKQYADIPEVPRDPYDIEAGLAKQLLRYDDTITLDLHDQATYDAAMAMTEDGGPCCCQCWRWYMTEGLAKFLITEQDMPAADVAEIVDLTNGCGGPIESDDSS